MNVYAFPAAECSAYARESMTTPPHVSWLTKTGTNIATSDGMQIEVWDFNYKTDETILSQWAKHFREHYCSDEELPALVEGTGKTPKEFLNSIKFPDPKIRPGPSTRSGDFGEILVADFIEYILGYWCPRQVRYEDRMNRNVSTNGCDILGFKFAADEPGSPDDELFLLEAKASLTTTSDNRLQKAVDDSIKDMTREAMSLSAIKQRLRRTNLEHAARVQRFQQELDRPFRRVSGAAAILENAVFETMPLTGTTVAQHPNVENLKLLVIKGVSLMQLVHTLYERAANEA